MAPRLLGRRSLRLPYLVQALYSPAPVVVAHGRFEVITVVTPGGTQRPHSPHTNHGQKMN